jgi:hypothetical protein
LEKAFFLAKVQITVGSRGEEKAAAAAGAQWPFLLVKAKSVDS